MRTSRTSSLGRVALMALTLSGAGAPLAAQQAGDAATPAAKGNESSQLTKNYAPQPRRGFNVVLLLGDMQAGEGQENIPLAARKALADMKDFLPYKGYRLLDTQWIIGGGSPAITRLRGVDDQEYELELRASATLAPGTAAPNQSNIAVRFLLRDGAAEAPASDSSRTALHPKELATTNPAAAEITREIFQLERERADLEVVAARARKQMEVGVKDAEEVERAQRQLNAVNRRIEDLKQSLASANTRAAGRPVIDTSFQMTDGETVVVGTSKVKGGGKALIALLTATTDRKGSAK
jgi:hypothetical protein